MTDALRKRIEELELMARHIEGDSDNPLRVAAANDLYAKAAALRNYPNAVLPFPPLADGTAA